MFQHTPGLTIAESLFTGIYIVVSKTETVKESEFNEILNFLNSELNIFDTNDLVSDFISSGEFDWFKDRIHFSSKLRLGPTQILWNSEEEPIGHEHILNSSKALTSLKEANTSSYFSDSTLQINYISEQKHKESANLFYKQSTIASLIIDRQSDIFSLVDLFYSKKDKYNDEVPFHFLLTRSGLVQRLIDEFDKYIVKENLHKYRKYNAEDDEFIHDCFVFVKESDSGNATDSSDHDTNILHSVLKEIVLNILTSFLSQLVARFSNEAYSLESIKKYILKQITHLHLGKHKKSGLKVNEVYNGTNVRLYGDLHLAINKKEMAMNYYTLSSYLFKAEGSELEYCRTLFALSIVIFKHHLSKLAADVAIAVSEPVEMPTGNTSIELDSDNYHAIGTVGIDVANESIEENAEDQQSSRTLENTDVTSEIDLNRIKIKYDKYDKYNIEGLMKDVGEKPLNYLLFYLNKSYTLWMRTSDHSVEVELLFAFYVNVLFKIKSPFVTKVINSFIIYSKRVCSKEKQCSILKYIIGLLSKSKYRRKLLFYQYLLEELVNGSKTVDTEQREYKYKDINYVICNLVSAVYNGLKDKRCHSLLDGLNFVEYEHWYQIKNTIIESQIVKLVGGNSNDSDGIGTNGVTSTTGNNGIARNNVEDECATTANGGNDKQELNRKVNKLVLMKYMNLFDYLIDLKYAVDLKMFERIKGEFVASPNHFIITHVILLSRSNGADANEATGTSTDRVEAVTVNRDDKPNDSSTKDDTGIRDDSGMSNDALALLNKMNKRGSSAHFIGGFEELQFNNFPIVYSIKLKQDNYSYQHSNIKKVEHVYSSTRRRSRYNILVKGSYKHFKIKPVYSDHVIEPRCVIMNKRLCIIYRCKLRKYDPSYTSRKRYKRTSSSSVGDSDGVNADSDTINDNSVTDAGDASVDNSASGTSGNKKYVEYVYDKVDKVVYVEKELSVEMKLDNPLPVCLVLKNVRLITIGATFDSELTEIEVPPFKRNFKHNLKIVIGEPGALHVIGISFLLFDKLQCYQLMFKDCNLLSHLLTRYEAEDAFEDNLKSDTGLMDLLKKSAVLELNAVNNYNKSRLDVYFTDFNNFYTDARFGNFYSIGSSRRTTSSSRVAGKISLNTSIYDSARSNMSRMTRSISSTSGVVERANRRTSIGSSSARLSSINTVATSNNPSIIDIDSIKSDMVSWLRVPKSGQGTVLKQLKLCMSYSCSYCNIFYSYYDSLLASGRGDRASINVAYGHQVNAQSCNGANAHNVDTANNANVDSSTRTNISNVDPSTRTNISNVDPSTRTNISNVDPSTRTNNGNADSGDNMEVARLINGEIKLIYVRLKNENKHHTFTNVKISALPYYTAESADHDVIHRYKNEVYGAKKRKIKNITIGGDYVKEKLKKNRLKNIKQQFYSKFIIILNEHCQLVRSDRVDCHDISVNNYHEHTGGVSVPPNETLYVPIIYKCNDIINNFNVILDYTIVKVGDGGASDTTNSTVGDGANSTERGYVHRNVKVKVQKSLEINSIKFENMVYFNLKHFIHNADEFGHLFKQSTLSSLKTYTPIFDHKCVRAFINIINKSDIKFNCVINRTNFVSDPNYTQRWSVKMRRMDYRKDVDLHEFTQMVLAHLQVKWTCDMNQIGVTNVYNLSDEDSYKLYTSSSYNNLTANSFNLENSWSHGSLSRRRLSMFERVIIRNLNSLIMSKLTIELSVSTNDAVGSAKGTFETSPGSKFTVNVLVRNNGYEPVHDYKVLIVPFNKECYTKTSGIEYTGCLEQIGACPIIGLSDYSTDTACNGAPNGTDTGTEHAINSSLKRHTDDWDYYLKVASVEFVTTEPGTLGINAAIISQTEKVAYWHHNPLTVKLFGWPCIL
ncbi:conserved hypothetical protein [Theileria orientalis strain Shintoku]|uniref:Uncharacterized protein n=1 Tax=Theileria orientalis strain Shintoku TaxID=869250 RepID=J4DNE4_THEOR|nr:conserved hypothetical protein [Theileria orientalis strain Shintoku]BAM38814.1 conserved hypothetical protein [Theileria orientalis strain Shintoku]|eukprot:XP_009689115.1 conserved hypothetical protein [Theileria orientalis strain Shintoku]